MQTNSTSFLILAAAVSFAGAGVGLILLVRGILGRRVGDERRCKACEYILTGIDSQRCPECGQPLTDTSVVRGQRSCRSRLAAIGTVLLLLALVGGGFTARSAARSIDWYEIKPTFLVMRDFRDPRTRVRALNEMDRRDRTAPLASAYRDEIVQQALIAQAAPKPPPETAALLDFAARQQKAKRLSEAQEKQLFQQCVISTLAVRKRVISGNRMPYRMDYESRTPTGWKAHVAVPEDAIDHDTRYVRFHGLDSITGIRPGGWSTFYIDSPEIGKHKLNVNLRVRVYEEAPATEGQAMRVIRLGFRSDPPAGANILFDEERHLMSRFEVVPDDGSGGVQFVHASGADPLLKQQIERAIRVRSVRWKDGQEPLGVDLTVDSMPIGVAFSVFAAFDNTEYELGTLIRSMTDRVDRSPPMSSRGLWNVVPPNRINLIFRPSKEVARQTVDLDEIWGEEIVMKDVSVMAARAMNQRGTANP